MIAKKLRIFSPRPSNFVIVTFETITLLTRGLSPAGQHNKQHATGDHPRDFFSIVARFSSAHANFLRDGRRNVVLDGARDVLVVCMHVHLVVCIPCVRGAARVGGSPGAHFGVLEVHFWSVGWPFLVVQVVIF